MQKAIGIKVVLFQDGTLWVAQCVNHDLASQGKTLEEAQRNLIRMIVGNVILDLQKGIKPLSQYASAPKAFQDIFNQSLMLGGGRVKAKSLLKGLRGHASKVLDPWMIERRIYTKDAKDACALH